MDIYSYQREMNANEIKLFYVKIEFRIINCYRRLEKIDALCKSDVYKNSPVNGIFINDLINYRENIVAILKGLYDEQRYLNGYLNNIKVYEPMRITQMPFWIGDYSMHVYDDHIDYFESTIDNVVNAVIAGRYVPEIKYTNEQLKNIDADWQKQKGYIIRKATKKQGDVSSLVNQIDNLISYEKELRVKRGFQGIDLNKVEANDPSVREYLNDEKERISMNKRVAENLASLENSKSNDYSMYN